jgi:hypothetical protein
MRIFNEDLTFDSTNLASSVTSEPIFLGHIPDYSIQIFFTGTHGGNFKLQVSNDKGNPQAALEVNVDYEITHWTDVADSAFTVAAAGDVFWDVQNSGARWVRVVWTQTSGSGTITSAKANGKGV